MSVLDDRALAIEHCGRASVPAFAQSRSSICKSLSLTSGTDWTSSRRLSASL
jgi:hypothetical protein